MYACQHFTSTKMYHLLIYMMMPELEDTNFTAAALLAAGSSFSIHFIKVKLFYQSGPFFFIHHMETNMIALFSTVSLCAWTLPEAPHTWILQVSLAHLCVWICALHQQPCCSQPWLGRPHSPAVWIPCQGLLRSTGWGFLALLLPADPLNDSIRRCFAAAVQHRGWACHARELLFAAFKYSADFIQALERLSSLWHSACFFSAVPPDGASSGEGLSWKDVKEVYLSCATKEYIHWAKTKTEIWKKNHLGLGVL